MINPRACSRHDEPLSPASAVEWPGPLASVGVSAIGAELGTASGAGNGSA